MKIILAKLILYKQFHILDSTVYKYLESYILSQYLHLLDTDEQETKVSHTILWSRYSEHLAVWSTSNSVCTDCTLVSVVWVQGQHWNRRAGWIEYDGESCLNFSNVDCILPDDTILLADGRWRPRKNKGGWTHTCCNNHFRRGTWSWKEDQPQCFNHNYTPPQHAACLCQSLPLKATKISHYK